MLPGTEEHAFIRFRDSVTLPAGIGDKAQKLSDATRLRDRFIDVPAHPEADRIWEKGGVGRVGLEPTTHALKVRCSTTELTTRAG